jgi:hypothetical protein
MAILLLVWSSAGIASSIHAAALAGSTETVLDLINRGVQVNDRSWDGTTPLMDAAAYCRVELLKELLKVGAKINLKDSDGNTAIRYAHVGFNKHDRKNTMAVFIAWSLEKQIYITSKKDKEILDMYLHESYIKKFKAYGSLQKRREAIITTTGISQDSVNIIEEYLVELPKVKRAGPRQFRTCYNLRSCKRQKL